MKKLIILLLLAATPTLHHDTLDGFVANEHIDWTDASADLRTSGNVKSGADDTTAGVFKAYGGGTGVTDGGCLQLHTAANYDTSINVYQVNVDEDNLVIKQGITTKLTLSGATGNFTFAGAGHDSFSDFVANEHIDWTDTTEDFLTTGTATIGLVGAIGVEATTVLQTSGYLYFYDGGIRSLMYLDDNNLIIENTVSGKNIQLSTNSGALLVDQIGVVGDTNVLQLGANALAVNGDVIVTGGLTVDTDTFVVDAVNHRVGIGTNAPDSIFHIKANTPGTVGSHPAGQLIIQDPDDTVFGNAVITGYESDGDGNPDQQLWYLGSSSGGNTDIIFLNRRNAKLALGTNGTSRITILGNGNVGINVTDPDAKLEVVGTLHISDAATFDGTLGAGAITGTSFITGGDIGVAGDTNLLQLAANALTVNGILALSTTNEINFRDSDISIGSTLDDGILDISADDSIYMFYDNADVGDAVDGQSLYIYRRAAEGDDYLQFYVGSDRYPVINAFPAIKMQVSGTDKFIIGATQINSEVVLFVKDKLAFTQTDLNEYIDSLNDGYMDYGATTGHRFNADIDIANTKVLKVNSVQVVGTQQDHIADAPGDTAANNATTINAILTALEAHGLLNDS